MKSKSYLSIFNIILTIINLSFAVFFCIYLSGDIAKSFKRDIYSISISGDPLVSKVATLDEPLITTTTITSYIKKIAPEVESIKLATTSEYLKSVEPYFEKDYFSQYSVDKAAESNILIKSDLRVVDFVVTDGPHFVGVEIKNNEALWLYHLKGSYFKDGIISSSNKSALFGDKEIWVKVVKGVGRIGNPTGVEIVEYRTVSL